MKKVPLDKLFLSVKSKLHCYVTLDIILFIFSRGIPLSRGDITETTHKFIKDATAAAPILHVQF